MEYTQGSEYGEKSRKISLEITNFTRFERRRSFWYTSVLHVTFYILHLKINDKF